uniref:Uncharacterized protein n=1 Tax=Daphnia galeata TaxID=27404 RepID=A0A8J2RB91_9CRUS|nr:unnamed protein product [Daphnia galeata]
MKEDETKCVFSFFPSRVFMLSSPDLITLSHHDSTCRWESIKLMKMMKRRAEYEGELLRKQEIYANQYGKTTRVSLI